MDRKLKCIVKRPDEPFGDVAWIDDSLESLQDAVEGYIETVPLEGNVVLICNEEGKLIGLDRNFLLGNDWIVGTVIIIGTDGDELADLPDSFTLDHWKIHYLKGLAWIGGRFG